MEIAPNAPFETESKIIMNKITLLQIVKLDNEWLLFNVGAQHQILSSQDSAKGILKIGLFLVGGWYRCKRVIRLLLLLHSIMSIFVVYSIILVIAPHEHVFNATTFKL